ncbi:MAG: 2-oxoacid:acceptor oxidoreductase family protein, partial [Dehalococcoidia bacterium]|nr:2-oxoacid:acceptor oxidoreductase family protein [Dehalococcoidia bacterium]
MKDKDPLNIIITGVGGQGNVLLSQLAGKALVRNGYHATIGETYGASQRGGAVMSHLRVSREKQYGPLIAQGQADIVLGL